MTSAYHFRGWAYVEAFRAAGLERSADAAFHEFAQVGGKTTVNLQAIRREQNEVLYKVR